MILVKVELHSAMTGKVSEIARVQISNDATGTVDASNYNGKSFRRGSKDTVQRSGRVEGHKRKQLHVLTLVRKMLVEMGY